MSGKTGEVMRVVLAGWLADWRWGQESLAAAALWRRLLQGGQGIGDGETGQGVSRQQLAALLGAGAVYEENGSRRAGSKAGQAGSLDLQTGIRKSVWADRAAVMGAASQSREQSPGLASRLRGGDYEAGDSDRGSRVGALAAAGDKSAGQRAFMQAAMEQALENRQRAAGVGAAEVGLNKGFFNEGLSGEKKLDKEVLNEPGFEMLTAVLATEAAGAVALQPEESVTEKAARGLNVSVESRQEVAVEASGLERAEAGFSRGVSEPELAELLFGGWEGAAAEAADMDRAEILGDLSLNRELGMEAAPGFAGWPEQAGYKGYITDNCDNGSAGGLDLEQLTEAVAEHLRDELEAALCSRGWL